jgi:hypothetical protein
MPDDVLYRFPWGTLDRSRSDRALREILQQRFGVKIDADEPPAPSSDEAPPDDIEYEVAIPEKIARQRHGAADAPLPPPDQGMFMGLYTIRADEDGAVLTLPWAPNAHVWSIMSEIVEAVVKNLGGWREPAEADERTDPGIKARLDGARSRSDAPPRPGSVAPPPPSQPTVQVEVPHAARGMRTPPPPPPSVEPQPNTKSSVPAPPPEADEEIAKAMQGLDRLDRGEDDGDLDDDDLERVFPGWDALKAWVADAYSFEEDAGEAFTVVMTWSATPRKQSVTIARSVIADEEWITFRSGVCRRGRISADQALRRSADLAFASIVGVDDRYELVYSFPLSGLTLGRFTSLLERVAEVADDLEAELTRGGDEF